MLTECDILLKKNKVPENKILEIKKQYSHDPKKCINILLDLVSEYQDRQFNEHFKNIYD